MKGIPQILKLFFYCRGDIAGDLLQNRLAMFSSSFQNIFHCTLSQQFIDQTLGKLLLVEDDPAGTLASVCLEHGTVCVDLADLSNPLAQLCSFCYGIHVCHVKRGLSCGSPRVKTMIEVLFSHLECKWLEEAFVGECYVAAGVVCCLAFAEGRQEHRRVRTAIHDFLLGEAVGDS